MLVFEKHFTEKREFNAPIKKAIRLTDKNIKVSKAGYIYIQKYIKGAHIRISTKLKYTPDNIDLVKEQANNYIQNELIRRGYIQQEIQRSPDEYLSQTIQYMLRELVDIKESSFARYKTTALALQKHLKHTRTNAINKAFLHDYALNLHEKGLSNAEIKYRVNFLVRVINNYNEYFNLPYFKNTLNLSKYGKEKKENNIFSENDLARILQTSKKDTEFFNYLMIAIHTGARVGEILALNKDDIDTESKVLKITKTKTQKNTLTMPKTKSSKRNIPFINKDFESFMQHLKATKKNNLLDITYNTLQTKWKKLLCELNIKETRIYNLRHTFATLAIKRGNSLLAVSYNLGHKNLNITGNTYAINQAEALQNLHFNIENNLRKEEAI